MAHKPNVLEHKRTHDRAMSETENVLAVRDSFHDDDDRKRLGSVR